MASLIKQSSGYVLQFYSSDRSPKRKKVTLKSKRKRPAERKARELEDAYVEGRFCPWTDDPFDYNRNAKEPLSIADGLERFLTAKEETGRSHYTLKAYSKVVNRVARIAGADTLLDRIRPEQINEYVRQRGIAQATKDRRYRHLRGFLNWCVEHGHCEASPLGNVEAPRRPDKMPKHVTKTELESICETIRNDYRDKHGRGICAKGEIIWIEPLFRFAFYTGMRGGELCNLQWDHIDFERSLIRILEQKNGREQTIPLLEKAREALDDVQGERSGYVFGSPRSDAERDVPLFRSYVSRRFTKYRRKAGVERRVSMHGLRHGFATALAQAGKSAHVIKEACRHGDLSTSLKYVHLANEHLKSELDDVF